MNAYRDSYTLYLRYSLPVTLLSLLACAQTSIQPYQPPGQIMELAALNSKAVGLVVERDSELADEVGRQFAYLVLPLGRVVLPELEQHLYDVAFSELAMRGFRPESVAKSVLLSPRLSFQVEDVALNAYDWLFLRKLSCRLELHSKLSSANGQLLGKWNSSVSEHEFAKQGFEPELRKLLNRCSERAVRESLDKLGL